MTWTILAVAVALGLADGPSTVRAQSGEAAGMITEIRLGGGTVAVNPAGAEEWRPAAPLMSLRAGDTVRATGGAMAVVLLTAGRGAVRVEASTGPVVIPPLPTAESKIHKARALVAASLRFLSTGARDVSQTVLGTRSLGGAAVVLGPRNGPILPDSLIFEWLGAPSGRYTVQVVGPAGRVVEHREVEGTRWRYPASASPLEPGVRYTFRVVPGAPRAAESAWFEVLGPARARDARGALATLRQELAASVPPNTLVALSAGYLADAGLLHEARRVLLEGIARDPDEPTLHLVLGGVYVETGLAEPASRSFATARALMRTAGRR
jgi:hypothetical protein